MNTVKLLTNLVEHHVVLTYALIYFGLVFEGELTLIVTGILAHLGALNPFFAFAFILSGSITKTFAGYYLGTVIRERWANVKFFKFFENRVRRAVPQFKEKPFWSIFISKFIIGAHTTVVLFSGFERIDFRKYLKADILATLVWAPGLILLGYFFSYTALHVSREITKFSLIVIGLFLLYVIFDRLFSYLYQLATEYYNDAT